MTNKVSTEEVHAILARQNEMLINKAFEYASDSDRLWNFKIIGHIWSAISNHYTLNPKYEGLLVLWLKHFVSMLDLTEIISYMRSGIIPQDDELLSKVEVLLAEKSPDNINYQILWELIIKEDISNARNNS